MLLTLGTYYFIEQKKETKVEIIESKRALPLKKTIKSEEISLNQEEKDCETLKLSTLEKIEKKIIPKVWSNYHLSKNKTEYILRIEKDSNNQDLEVDRVKFYELDEEGLPTSSLEGNNTIIESQEQLNSLMEDYKILQHDEVFYFQGTTVRKTDGKIQIIEQSHDAKHCYF